MLWAYHLFQILKLASLLLLSFLLLLKCLLLLAFPSIADVLTGIPAVVGVPAFADAPVDAGFSTLQAHLLLLVSLYVGGITGFTGVSDVYVPAVVCVPFLVGFPDVVVAFLLVLAPRAIVGIPAIVGG
jgi:hypothetical protein